MSVFDQVLVVDESPLVRRVLRSSLEAADYWVHEAKDAASARELLAVRGYDLLVVGRTGFELLPLAHSAGAAVIVLTASPSADLHAHALELGADACLAKHKGVAQEVVRSACRLLQAPAAPVRNRQRGFARPSVAA